jgi:hypothetical protein
LIACPELVNIQNDFDIDIPFNVVKMMTPLYYAVSRNMNFLPFRNQYFSTTNPVKDSYY